LSSQVGNDHQTADEHTPAQDAHRREREAGGTRRSRVGRCWPFVGGEGGGWVLGERPPPGVRAMNGIIRRALR